ncbi:MAG: SDR family NAD(P)-dependent oxidoreductase [Planctomycetota bacterium]|nr:SDR family NAD(P)-dependent oxidoreductase [Planctomycetota bacterium]
MVESRTIVVTGASRGIGRALALDLAEGGHRVFACGRSAAELPGVTYARVDVSDDDAVRAWSEEVLRADTPNLVIASAGVMHRNAPLWELADEEVARVLDVNVRGVATTARHFLPALINAGAGVLANLSSGWGRSTSPEGSIYCASKWAVEGLTQALAAELPSGVAAVAVNPGIIDTEMLRSCFGGAAGSYPTPQEWVRDATPFFLGLSAKDNGRALTV